MTTKKYIICRRHRVIVYVHEDLIVLTDLVNEKLSLLFDWCCCNKMVINPSKSQYILVTNRFVPMNPIINLGTDSIEREKSCKYLGLYLDEKSKFHDHFNNLKSKLRQFCGMSFRITKYLDYKRAKKISIIWCTLLLLVVLLCGWNILLHRTWTRTTNSLQGNC